MEKVSRRNVLLLAAAGTAEIGALAASAAVGAHFASASTVTTTAQKPPEPRGNTSQGPLAAFVPDAQGDTIVIMRGEQELTITNQALVQTLLSLSSL